MADDSIVDDDDESKIVTHFLLNTCRLRQPSLHNVIATWRCAMMVCATSDNEHDTIPLITGSTAEFYIQPMLSCVGDIDIMIEFSTELAVPDGYPPPTQLPAEFHSLVEVYEIIDSEYPGYVYLMSSYFLTEHPGADKYVMQYTTRDYMPTSLQCNVALLAFAELHGPAYRRIPGGEHLALDYVMSVRCLSWPTQAADWLYRHSNYGWPDSATVDRVINSGCDVVRVAHRQCRQDEWMSKHQWRLSFSRAEIVLLNSWMPLQQIVYHMLRVFVKTERLTDITDSTETQILSNYHIKTLILWTCELKPRSWWIDDVNVVKICVELLHILADWLKNKNCPHYFVNNCSLFDNSLQAKIIAIKLVSITKSWLSTWFVNNYLRKCARLFDNVSSSMKLQNMVSAIVDQGINSALINFWLVRNFAEFHISGALYIYSTLFTT